MLSISSGHWWIGSGAIGLIDEVREARKVAKRVTQILTAAGVDVNYIEDNTSSNQKQNLSYLVSQHNKSSRQLDVSVHFNASTGTVGKGMGTEVLYHTAQELAAKMSKAIATASGLIDRGAKQRTELSFLSNTNKPAILLEICFVNSSVDVALYRRDFEKICSAIANTLLNYLGKQFANTSEVKNVKLLTATGRAEIRDLLKTARQKKIIGSTHTDEKIENYSDVELLSYQAAIINRTFK